MNIENYIVLKYLIPQNERGQIHYPISSGFVSFNYFLRRDTLSWCQVLHFNITEPSACRGWIAENVNEHKILSEAGMLNLDSDIHYYQISLLCIPAAASRGSTAMYYILTFQLLTQVSGRAGRSKIKGEVIIQTQNEKNFVLQKVVANDYHGFYEHEIRMREEKGYPPFTRICLVESKDENEADARGALTDFYNIVTGFKYGLRITPPSEAIIAKIKKNFRFHLLIKNDKRIDPSGNLLRKAVLESFIKFNQKSRYRSIQLNFDIDPQSVL